MKLYYAPFACSLAPQIVALEAGIDLPAEKVDLRTHRTASGADYREINPLGYVPALHLDDGRILTEGVAILQHLADLAPQAMLAPPAGTFERTRLQQWLGFVAAELHKSFSPWLFHPEVGEAAQEYARGRIRERFAYLEAHLAQSRYLLGDAFGIADAYAYTIVGWSKTTGIGLAPYPALGRYMEAIGARASVREALKAQLRSGAA